MRGKKQSHDLGRVTFFDIFLGVIGKDQMITKVRSVGHAKVIGSNQLDYIFLKDPFAKNYRLDSISTLNMDYDYHILNFGKTASRSFDLNIVGTGKILSGKNAGLIRLDFDLLESKGIYLNLNNNARANQSLKAA